MFVFQSRKAVRAIVVSFVVMKILSGPVFAQEVASDPLLEITALETPAADLSQELVGLKLSELCPSYRLPTDVFGQPLPPFRVSEKIQQARREAAPFYTQTFEKYFVAVDQLLQLRLRWQALFSSLSRLGNLLREPRTPNIYVIDQRRLCQDTAAERVLNEGGHLAEGPRRDMFQSLFSTCMDEAYGRANPFANDIILSEGVAWQSHELGSEFAFFHEVCHIQYPGIQNSYLEEIFCDAVALRWMVQVKSPQQLKSIAREVRRILKPKNPFADILVLRSQLPLACY